VFGTASGYGHHRQRFLADESLRADHIGKCRENPGELGETPNCRNAEEAEGKARLERMNRALGG
jgi:hypothetical protein